MVWAISFQDEEEEKIIEEALSGKKLITISKEENFTLWYKTLLRIADIIDDRYPTKGMYMFPAYGYELTDRVMNIIRRLMKETGHREERYPTLIPMSVFMREKDFFEGFQGEGYIVTKTFRQELEEPLVVRPTSETVMYHFWSQRINSYKQLPLKVFQIVNIFRSETKMTKPLLRVREVAFFKEAHTVHATREDSERQIEEALEAYKKFYDELLIPYLVVKTPEWDTFPGALYNYDIFTVMPDGKGLELGSVINLGQKFAKAFDIKFLDKDGEWKYAWQTCYGVSERSVGAVISIHGDDKGLILPPHIAPIQIVIVPIYYSDEEKNTVYAKSDEIKEKLKDFRVEIDKDEDRRPGFKFYYWEMKGVPVRIEIGMRDLKEGKLTIYRRDTDQKTKIDEKELTKEYIEKLFEDIKETMREKARKWFWNKLKIAKNLEEFEKHVKETVVIIPHCGEKTCAQQIGEKYERDLTGYVTEGIKEKPDGKCIICGNPAKHWAVIAKTY